jgi:ABC-type polysaccharide/polyol phosphate transport system ATPase subunit
MDVVRCEGVGIRFARGSRRAMVAASLRRVVGLAPAADVEPFWALRDVSFRVPAGVRLGVCGGNGSGKTTLLRVLCGIYEPDEGAVAIAGRTSTLLSLGAGIDASLSGHDNIHLAGALHGLTRDEVASRYGEIADFAELGPTTLATPVRYYSAGMRTRLGFAIASTFAPDVLLLDELLATGDAPFREKSAAKLRELTERARCTIVTSHNAAFLREHTDVMLWLDQGRTAGYGPTAEILDEYKRFKRGR